MRLTQVTYTFRIARGPHEACTFLKWSVRPRVRALGKMRLLRKHTVRRDTETQYPATCVAGGNTGCRVVGSSTGEELSVDHRSRLPFISPLGDNGCWVSVCPETVCHQAGPLNWRGACVMTGNFSQRKNTQLCIHRAK